MIPITRVCRYIRRATKLLHRPSPPARLPPKTRRRFPMPPERRRSIAARARAADVGVSAITSLDHPGDQGDAETRAAVAQLRDSDPPINFSQNITSERKAGDIDPARTSRHAGRHQYRGHHKRCRRQWPLPAPRYLRNSSSKSWRLLNSAISLGFRVRHSYGRSSGVVDQWSVALDEPLSVSHVT